MAELVTVARDGDVLVIRLTAGEEERHDSRHVRRRG
jgi:hypothetical protein